MATIIGDSTDKLNIFNEIRKRIEGKFDCIIQKATERRDTLLEQLTEWEREYRVVIEGLEELKSSKQEMEQLYSTLKSETARKSLEKSIDELSERIRDSDHEFLDLSFVCETNDFEWRISQLGVLTQDIFVEAYSSNENGSQSTMLKPDPVMPLPFVFQPTNVFSPTPNTGFPFSATGTTSIGFPFLPATQLPTQIIPTTPQTPTYAGLYMDASKPSSDAAVRVIKTTRRRRPHKK